MLESNQARIGKKKSLLMFAGLTACGILINILGARLNVWFNLPFYLDNIGTILTALVGGYLPCIAVGFLYNIIAGIGDNMTTYYCFVSVLIAWAAAFFARTGWLTRFPKVLAAVLTFAVFGGIGGGILTWFLYGLSSGEGAAAVLAQNIVSITGMSRFTADLTANFLIDIADKAISTAAALLLWKLLPKRFTAYCGVFKEQIAFFSGSSSNVKRKKLSLRAKVLLLVGVSSTLVAVSAVTVCILQYHHATIDKYIDEGRRVTAMMARNIDPDRLDIYIEKGRDDEEYADIEDMLYSVNDSVPDVTYIYVYKITEDGTTVVFDLDTPQLKADKHGDRLEHNITMRRQLDDFLAGKEIEPVITNDEYGWMLTVYQPLGEGDNLCYAAADMSMERMRGNEVSFLTRLISLFIGFLSLIMIFAMWIADRFITEPINRITDATNDFAYDTAEAREESVERLRDLNIHTGDEIENLYTAILKTTSDTMGYIGEVQEKGEQISKLQNGLIMVLADMVESRDQCTGDHIKKTAAYTKIIMEQMKREGIYAEQMTDGFIDDVVHSAPLHDIGKIHVPDAVLNKPGRLTEEEYKQIQEHTTAGGEIIDRAIASISGDSGYLCEARNLAAAHHEKWNGKGYPLGLKGEEIPLSARIMAVADVFDALVSRRSYKTPFSVDKAIEIIVKDAGTHFDEKVVKAFIDAEDEIRRVAEENSEE